MCVGVHNANATAHHLSRYESDEPHLTPLPGGWGAKLPESSFGRLLLLRALREEKLAVGCMQ
jgi:hypothetical protein